MQSLMCTQRVPVGSIGELSLTRISRPIGCGEEAAQAPNTLCITTYFKVKKIMYAVAIVCRLAIKFISTESK